MNRVEENKQTLKDIEKFRSQHPAYDAVSLALMVTLLEDISRSLATIATDLHELIGEEEEDNEKESSPTASGARGCDPADA